MDLSNCNIRTPRLLLKEWHSFGSTERAKSDLTGVVISILTEPVTRSLPPAWQGDYSTNRAADWIHERDSEGTTLLAISAETSQPVGLMILYEIEDIETGDEDIRLGYLLAESAWGSGMATEMVSGFLDWCRSQDFHGTITAGVERDNQASRRVLEKNGLNSGPTETSGSTETIYRLRLG